MINMPAMIPRLYKVISMAYIQAMIPMISVIILHDPIDTLIVTIDTISEIACSSYSTMAVLRYKTEV